MPTLFILVYKAFQLFYDTHPMTLEATPVMFDLDGYLFFGGGSAAIAVLIVCFLYWANIGGGDPKDPKDEEKARRRAKIEQDRKDIERALERRFKP